MNVLLTGAFGNVGTSALTELLKQGHRVRCFDLKTKMNEKAARRIAGRAEVVWGDLRNPGDVAAAVRGQDVVTHLAFIIPKLSVTGVESEKRPDWARTINVGGTQNVIDAMKAQPRPPKLVFASSLHVYGLTQDQPPPRTVSDPVDPIEHYARHKVECEQRIRASGLEWAILRFAAAMPISLKLDPGMFDVPLANRMEFVHTRDVGLAVANAASQPGRVGPAAADRRRHALPVLLPRDRRAGADGGRRRHVTRGGLYHGAVRHRLAGHGREPAAAALPAAGPGRLHPGDGGSARPPAGPGPGLPAPGPLLAGQALALLPLALGLDVGAADGHKDSIIPYLSFCLCKPGFFKKPGFLLYLPPQPEQRPQAGGRQPLLKLLRAGAGPRAGAGTATAG